MKVFLCLSLLVALTLAEPPRYRQQYQSERNQYYFARQQQEVETPAEAEADAPYPASGWKPAGPSFELPQRQQQQQNAAPAAPQRQYGAPQTAPQQQYGAPAAPQQQYGEPAAPQQQYGEPAAPQQQYGAPQASPQQQYRKPQASPQQQYRAPASPQQQYRAPASPQQQYRAPASPQQQYRAPASPQQQYRVPASPQQQFRVPESPAPAVVQRQYAVPAAPQKQYGEPAAPQEQQYGAPAIPQQQYGAPEGITTTEEPNSPDYEDSTALPGATEPQAEPVDSVNELDEEGEVDEQQRQSGEYYVALPDGRLQRVQYMSSQDIEAMKYFANIRAENVEPLRGPVYAYAPLQKLEFAPASLRVAVADSYADATPVVAIRENAPNARGKNAKAAPEKLQQAQQQSRRQPLAAEVRYETPAAIVGLTGAPAAPVSSSYTTYTANYQVPTNEQRYLVTF